MNTYLLISCYDHGIDEVMTTQANSVKEAIEGEFRFFPLDPKDMEASEIRKRIYRFYNVDDDPNWDLEEVENFVDGDSNAQITIFEIAESGAVRSYPKRRID